MRVSHLKRWLLAGASALLVVSALFIATYAQQEVENGSSDDQYMLAGLLGKSSSASARVTLIIPPRPEKVKNEASTKQQTGKKVEKDTAKK